MFAEAELAIGERRLPVAPKNSFLGAGPSARAFVVRGGVAEEHIVLLGNELGSDLTILDGLSAGDRVVQNPTVELHDGVRVR
jgi:hypothetical protein